MTEDKIIKMALEAGFSHPNPHDGYMGLAYDYRDGTDTGASLKRFAELVAAASEEQWKQAVINELVCCHIYNESHDKDPRKAVHDAISWNVEVALDPAVSSQAQALIDLGADAEREACARFVEDGYVRQFEKPWREDLAAAIRARGNK